VFFDYYSKWCTSKLKKIFYSYEFRPCESRDLILKGNNTSVKEYCNDYIEMGIDWHLYLTKLGSWINRKKK
jgi:hypothetical protein